MHLARTIAKGTTHAYKLSDSALCLASQLSAWVTDHPNECMPADTSINVATKGRPHESDMIKSDSEDASSMLELAAEMLPDIINSQKSRATLPAADSPTCVPPKLLAALCHHRKLT